MSENTQNQNPKQEQYSLNDDRRVKVLSPGALVAKRFFRNRLAVVGLSILVAMFLFSFVGGLVSPYGQDEQFFTYTQMSKEFVGVTRNDTMRFVVADGQNFGSIAQSKALEAVKKGNTEFNYKDVDYTVDIQSDDFYVVYQGGDIMGYASRDLVNEADGAPKFSFDVKLAALTAMTAGEKEFTADGVDYTLDADGNILAGGEELGYVSRLVVSAADSSVVVTRDFKNRLEEAIDDNAAKFNYTDAEGNEAEYDIVYDASTKVWSVKQMTETYVYDRYAAPSKEHWLGTDTNGMDMLTRLMYGGRVSLIIGFIVVVIEASLGILMGGISGYFGGWIDNIIMRIVDVFYCIPSMPVIIIIGAANGRDACRFLEAHDVPDADPGLPRLAEHCPSGSRSDPLPARAGVHAGHRGLRHQGPAPHLPPSDPQRHPAADRHLHDGPRLHHPDRSHAVLPRSGRQVSVCLLGQHHQRRQQRLRHDELPVHLDPCRCLPAAHRSGLQLCGRRSARCV